MSYHTHGGDVYRNKNVIDFSANCNPFGTPESVKKAAALAMEEVFHYPDTDCQKLREAIGAYEKIGPEWIICGNGAADLIYRLVLVTRPKQALLLAPTFAEYEQALEIVDCEVKHYELKEENGFHVEKGFVEEITEKTDMVFLCNPNNPTGILLEREFILQILKRCKEKNSILILDECFVDFVEEPEKHTMKDMLKEYPNLFLLKAFTKRYAMAGVRLGYGLSRNQKLLEQAQHCGQPWAVSTVAQKAGVVALKEEAYVKESTEYVQIQRKKMIEKLNALGYQTFDSKANYIFFKGEEDLYEKCLKKGILIRDCSNYYGLKKGYYRVAVKLQEENNKLLEVLEMCRKDG